MAEDRRGTCAWCECESVRLSFLIWIFNEELYTDWVCERCRRAMGPTADENED